MHPSRCLPALLALGLVAALPAAAQTQQDGSAQDILRKARGTPDQRSGAATRGPNTTLQHPDTTQQAGARPGTEADDATTPRPATPPRPAGATAPAPAR